MSVEEQRRAEDPSLESYDLEGRTTDETQADRAALLAAGYRPVLRWRRDNVICSTGEALKNIEIAEKQAACTHPFRARRLSGIECTICDKRIAP